MKLTVGEIARACKGKLVIHNHEGNCVHVTEETQVTCVAHDSRAVVEGGVFIAVSGERVDGHKFIPQVFAKGAVLAITEKTPEQVEEECQVPAEKWGSYVLVENSLEALKAIGAYYRTTLHIPVIGITGSVGKTSTKQFIAGVLAEKYRVYRTEGNYNNEIGVPLSLLQIREEHEVAVIEMGISDFGEMHRLSSMARPNICVITNIGQCHLENLKSREGILKAKTEIFDYMASDGEVCLNGEDDMLRTVGKVRLGTFREDSAAGDTAEDAAGQDGTAGAGMDGVAAKDADLERTPHYFGFGSFPGQEVWASDIVGQGLLGSDATLHIADGRNGQSFSVHIPLPGRHMVINAAAATCVANLLGLSEGQIQSGLEKLKAVEGRTNLIQLGRTVLIDDCYNANPVSMKSALDLLGMADTYRVAILGDMFELGTDSGRMHAEVGEYAVKSGADHIICVGKNSRYMWEHAVETVQLAQQEADGGKQNKKQEILYFADLESLLCLLQDKREELVPEGCTVLVKASHGMEFRRLVDWFQNEKK